MQETFRRLLVIFVACTVFNVLVALIVHPLWGLPGMIFLGLAAASHSACLRLVNRARIAIESLSLTMSGISGTVAALSLLGAGFMTLLSPLALLDDSGDAWRNLLSLALLIASWAVSGLLGAWAAWRLYRIGSTTSPLEGLGQNRQ